MFIVSTGNIFFYEKYSKERRKGLITILQYQVINYKMYQVPQNKFCPRTLQP